MNAFNFIVDFTSPSTVEDLPVILSNEPQGIYLPTWASFLNKMNLDHLR